MDTRQLPPLAARVSSPPEAPQAVRLPTRRTGSRLFVLHSRAQKTESTAVRVNDTHSRLNETRVHRVVHADCIDAIRTIVTRVKAEGRPISIAGGRHAMGGQQFAADAWLLDTGAMSRVLRFDPQEGLIEAQAGIRWPELIGYLRRAQAQSWPQWSIRQKQTGADRMSLGGSLSANIHGRGLRFKPMIADVESFTLVDAEGRVHTCSRAENSELFRLVIGGYGLFGVIATVTLRLTRRRKLQRLVKVMEIEELVPALERRIAQGCLYGDFQFAIDASSEDFLRKGVFSCHQPIRDHALIPESQRRLHPEDWMLLLHLAHEDKSRAFELYSSYYLTTHGQRYWSDEHQLSEYLEDYHRKLDRRLPRSGSGTEMITEVYVPRDRLVQFMEAVRGDLRRSRANVVYGTVRFIERDSESFLAWARDRYACIVFNLHTRHTRISLYETAENFRGLITRAMEHGGSYYLTYHHWATPTQVRQCHPRFEEFLRLKRAYDPEQRFQSEWYRHYEAVFADTIRAKRSGEAGHYAHAADRSRATAHESGP